MEQKKLINNTYKEDGVVEVFDDNRKRFLYQRYKHKIEADFLKDTIAKVQKTTGKIKVLDVACGTGRMFREIANIKNLEYHGVDTSEEMMSHLKETARKMQCISCIGGVILGDATDLPHKDNTFDVVFTYHLTWHLPQDLQIKMIKEMMRVAKPNGYIVFDILNKDFVWEKHKHLLGKKKLDTIYKMSFKDIEELLYGHEYEIEKLSDFPIKNSFLYSLANVVNLSRSILPTNMYHMLFFRVQK